MRRSAPSKLISVRENRITSHIMVVSLSLPLPRQQHQLWFDRIILQRTVRAQKQAILGSGTTRGAVSQRACLAVGESSDWNKAYLARTVVS